jgi:hypothetical protein
MVVHTSRNKQVSKREEQMSVCKTCGFEKCICTINASEFLEYLNCVQVTLSHLIQDADVLETGLTSVYNLLRYTEELQKKIGDSDE